MKKISLFLVLFLVSSIFANWTNKVSDKLLNPQKYFKKQKIRIYRNSIPVQTNESGICMWSGCKTDKGAYFETELECVVYTTNEGKFLLLTDSEYSNLPESPYKGFYRRGKVLKEITESNFLNKVSLYASQSLVNYYKNNPAELKLENKDNFFKFLKGSEILSVKMAIKKGDTIIYVSNSKLIVDGKVLSDTYPLYYRSTKDPLKKENGKWVYVLTSLGTFFSNLGRYFGYNEDATKLVVE